MKQEQATHCSKCSAGDLVGESDRTLLWQSLTSDIWSGSYKASAGDAVCEICPQYFNTSAAGSVSREECNKCVDGLAKGDCDALMLGKCLVSSAHVLF
jgi:hypothetical protein